MSSQLQVSGEAKIRDIQGPVVANSGVITALDGAASQYVRGDGTLADFPTSSGGGSSVSYYLNSSVSQGTIGGVAYRELSKDPIIGAGTDIAISSNGYVANYITDVNDPDVTIVAGGNFNCEFYFSVNNNTGNPFTYAELYKYDGTTFTLLGSSVAVPEYINQGTIIAPYYFAIPVPTSALALTDRLAIRIYVNVDGRTVTLHTENGHLCQVVTTLSKGMVSLNNLTDQSQFITTGTAGTNFAIASSGDTHTFNLPVASATNTGKLSSTDWSTFNNKQNTITDPITGTGVSTGVAYFNSGTSITSEAAFNYDASTNRLGVNTSVPNATIGANAALDSGYSLLVKNDNANYNGIGFATDSTYGNLIATEKLGTALTRNLTLLNQSGYVSLTEAGNLGVGILTPNTGLDIYNGTSAYLWLHTANSGITGTDGVRLALFSTNGANLRNYEGAFSITAEGDFSIITIGAENFRVNSADGSIYQSKVANAMLKSVSGVITAAVAGTDYVLPSALIGYVPTSRTLTINGTAYDLSADRSWTVGTMGGSGVSGRVAYYDGTNSITSEAGFIYDASTNRLGVNTTVPNATIGADSALDSGYGLLIKTGSSNYNGIGIAIDSTYGNLISTEKLGSASARNLTLLNQSGFVSLTESGNLGLNVLTPAVSGNGIDIYGSTSVGLRFHTAASGTTVSDGAGINFSAGNNLGITNYEAGTIDIVTNGNSGVFIDSSGNVGIKGATPSSALTVTGAITQSSVTSALLKSNGSGTLVAAVAGTDYVIPSALSGYLPLTGGTLTGALNISNDRVATPIPFKVSNDLGYGIYVSADNTLNFNYSRNDYSSGYINYRGYLDGVTQFRDLIISDGKTSSIAMFTGSTKQTTLYGGVSATTALFSGLVTAQSSIYQTNASGAVLSNRFGTYSSGTTQLFLDFPSSGSVAFNNGSDKLTIASNGDTTIIGVAPILAIQSNTTGNIFLRFRQSADTMASMFYTNATATFTMSNNMGGLRFNTSGTSDALNISSGGVATFSSNIIVGNAQSYGYIYGPSGQIFGSIGANTTWINSGTSGLRFNNAADNATLMYIFNAGNVAINTTTNPTSGGFTNTTLLVKQVEDGGSGGGIQIEGNGTDNVAFFGFSSGSFNIGTSYRATGSYKPISLSSGGGALVVETNGVIRIVNLAGTGSRAVLADGSGNLSAPVSDISVKENLNPIGYGLNEILKMNPVWFDFIDEYKNYGEGRQNGNIAQEMQEIIPEAVFTTPSTGKMGINYDQLHAVYIKAIQELKAEIEELKNK